MREKVVLKAGEIEEAITLYLEFQKRYPTKTIEVYVYGCDNNL